MREHANSEELCELAVKILVMLMDDEEEIIFQIQFYNSGGQEALEQCAASEGTKDLLRSVLNAEMVAKYQDGSMATFSFGTDLHKFMKIKKENLIPQLQASSRVREIVEQEIVKFTESKKEPSLVKKKRLVCVDKFDIVVYGGPNPEDDDVFTHVIVTYPLSKVVS